MSDTVKLNPCPKCGAPIPTGAPQGLCPKCVLLGAAAATDTGIPATATSEIPSLERVAAAFPQLEILELIGRGGMGFVFKARQPRLDRFVALKLLPDKLARDPRFAERFNREGRVLAKLNHPNIVSVFDFGNTEHFYFLLMEFVDGVNLRQAMQAGRFSPAEALTIVPKICEALQYAHGQGVLHRDIKPENILLDARGQVKIADFGIAKLVGEEKPDVSLTATGAALGTLHYMAPEQLEKPADVDHRADIYSLGVVFYEMLTGELPIGRFAAPSAKTPVGVNVDEVVFRTLEKDRERRYQSAGEMKTQVEHLTDAGPASPTAPPKLPGAAGAPASRAASGAPDVPKWSQKAVWGAALTGLSLPFPVLLMFLIYFFRSGGLGGWEILILLLTGSLPGLVGIILGWMALSDLRVHQGRLYGLPLALFAAFAWPLLILVGGTVVPLWLVLAQPAPPGNGSTLAAMLALLIPAGAITFAIWTVRAAARWAGNQPETHRRGVLNWIFIALLLAGFGLVVTPKLFRGHPVQTPPAVAELDTPTATPPTVDTAPWIRITFTAVELRETDGTSWLAIDYVDDVHGDCQKSFPWEARIPGFKAETRTSEFVKDNEGSPSVRHQRVEYRLPASVPREQLEKLRADLEISLKQKSVRLEPGEQKSSFLLFELRAADGVLLKAWVKLVPPLKPSPGQAAEQTEAGETLIRLAREQLNDARRRLDTGTATAQEMAEAERQLAVAEARGDAVAVARANLKFADFALEIARKQFTTGVLSSSELRRVESRRALAELELNGALKSAASPRP